MPKKTKKNNPRYVVGIDLGGTKILAAVVDDKGQVLGRSKRKTRGKTDNATDPETVTDRVVTCVQDAVAAAGLKLGDIAAVGASAPGPVNVETGFVARMANLPGWEEGFAFGPELSKRLKLPVWVDNDVNLGTLGEVVYGAGRGMKDVIGIFVGTGIGGGIVLGGKLRRGVRWAAGEIGHMFVDISAIQRGGPVCGCGEPGHVEAIASRGAISRRLAAAIAAGEPTLLAAEVKDESELTSGAIRRAWEAGDELTR
ncbi:MAG: ROK family protein, partial [Caldilineales bacterium]|nr:ROK family protein [Caldilineales bacterium]